MLLPKEEKKVYDFTDKSISVEKTVLFISKVLITMLMVLVLITTHTISIINTVCWIYIMLLPQSAITVLYILSVIIGIPIIIVKNIIKLVHQKHNDKRK